MTNFGKCETCRARKVKCNEERPKCAACKKKGRTCHYKFETDSIFVHEHTKTIHKPSKTENFTTSTIASSSYSGSAEWFHDGVSYSSNQAFLSLERVRRAGTGSGEFYTFRTRTKKDRRTESDLVYRNSGDSCIPFRCPISALLVCPQTRICARWGSLFGIEALDLKPLGKWVKSAWLSAEEDAYLDHASNYTLESMRAFQCRDQTSLARACAVGGRALRSLQAAVNFREARQNLIFAVMLHCAAEQFMNLGSYSFIPHVLGISELLGKSLKNGDCNEAIRDIIHVICITETNVSIFMGRCSLLEDISKPDTSLSGPFELGSALFAVDYLLIQVPRLICLVRLAMVEPAESKNRIEATILANELYDSAADLYACKTLAMHTSTIECSNGSQRSPNDYIFEFHSPSAFVLGIRYHVYRVLACGALQKLHSLDASGLCSDAITVQQQDLVAATSIAMCLDYALKPGTSMPLTALGIILPFEMAFQTWHRLQTRQRSTDTVEYQWAVRMKDWMIESLAHLHTIWNNKPLSRERMEEVGDMLAGGPLVQYIYSKKYMRSDFIRLDNLEQPKFVAIR